MNKILLSIIIPTYNGGDYIQDALLSVLQQIEPHKGIVEIIVRDNASTDNTKTIVDSINDQYHNTIKYDRRQTTAIADVNYREALELSSGEYILMLGDDDLLLPNFMTMIIDAIQNHSNIGLFYCNRIATTRDFNGASLKHNDPTRNFYKKYESAEEFIADYPSGPDFMSVNIVRRDCLKKGYLSVKEKYYGVEWYYALLAGIQGYNCISFFTPMILQRFPQSRIWSDKILLYVCVGMDNLFKDLSSIYPSAYNIWQNYLKDNISISNYIINCIPLNPSLYKSKWHELSPKLSLWNRLVAYILTCMPSISYPIVLVCRILLKMKVIH